MKDDRYHALLAGIIEQVLRCRYGPIRVPDLAEFAGFSRFHLTRLFQEVTEETLQSFLRRMRLERAAVTLSASDAPILEIAAECGYSSPVAFARAFRRAYGVLPTEFRQRTDLDWRIPAVNDLHWNADFVRDRESSPVLVSSNVRWYGPRHAAVWRALGNYARLSDSWARFESQFANQIPRTATFVTIYLDNMWTHPTAGTMRADIGWIVDSREEIPTGMRRRLIPAGNYASSEDFVPRTERNDAWSYMSGVYAGGKTGGVSYDEYRAWPLPFESVETKIFVRLPD